MIGFCVYLTIELHHYGDIKSSHQPYKRLTYQNREDSVRCVCICLAPSLADPYYKSDPNYLPLGHSSPVGENELSS